MALRGDGPHLHSGQDVGDPPTQRVSVVACQVRVSGAAGVAAHEDFALRCIMETTKQPADVDSDGSFGVHGVLMATCCHHRCRWDSFVGRPLLEEWGLARQDFELLTSMAGWATCAARAPQAGAHQECPEALSNAGALNRYLCMGLSVERRAEVGRRCKLLLDTARARYLSARLDSRLVYFITPDVTPENVAILATV
ncbi:hypothetical protein MTO96_017950 [Rhipicephalus appendiculatus]